MKSAVGHVDLAPAEPAVLVRFAGLTFLLHGLHRARAAVALRFAATDAALARGETAAGTLSFCEGAAEDFPPVDTAGFEETFALEHGRSRLAFDGRLCRGAVTWDAARADASIRHAPVAVADMLGVVENVLRIATAVAVRARGGLLLHSAAIAIGDEAIVLVGRSGAGKSTASRTALARGQRVLSDELNALFLDGSGLTVAPVPFAGDFGEAPQSARLRVRGLYLLEQGRDEVRSTSRGRAAAALVAATPFLNTDVGRTQELLDAALDIARAGRAGILALALGGDAWAVCARGSCG